MCPMWRERVRESVRDKDKVRVDERQKEINRMIENIYKAKCQQQPSR